MGRMMLVYGTVAILAACNRGGEVGWPEQGAAGSPQGAAGSTGASGASSAGDVYGSGSRLKLRQRAADDGATAFAGWWDQDRSEACEFQLAADGVERCLPQDRAPFSTYWADAACTKPLAIDAGCGQPKYLALASTSCAGGIEVLPITGPYPLTTMYAKTSACVPVSIPDGMKLFATGAPLDPGSFVGSKVSP